MSLENSSLISNLSTTDHEYIEKLIYAKETLNLLRLSPSPLYNTLTGSFTASQFPTRILVSLSELSTGAYRTCARNRSMTSLFRNWLQMSAGQKFL